MSLQEIILAEIKRFGSGRRAGVFSLVMDQPIGFSAPYIGQGNFIFYLVYSFIYLLQKGYSNVDKFKRIRSFNLQDIQNLCSQRGMKIYLEPSLWT